MDNIVSIANRTIPQPKKLRKLYYMNGTTGDIVKVILQTAPISLNDTAVFSREILAQSLYHTLQRLWHFLKSNIEYSLDPPGVQMIQTPAYTWFRKKGDCKSYTIFISSVLKNLSIDHVIRFVSFTDTPEWTHVYVVVPSEGKDIIMDVVMPQYNQEKQYTFKKDYPMTKVYQVSGIKGTPGVLFDLGDRDISQISDGEMDLLIAKDRLLTEKAVIEGIRGIGTLKAEQYQDSLDMINDSLAAVDAYKRGLIPDIQEELNLISHQAAEGQYSLAKEMSGVGAIFKSKTERQAAAVQRKDDRADKKATKQAEKPAQTKTGALLTKVATGVKTASKAVTKVATAPARLAAKGILEVTLPNAAPFFLYLFLSKDQVAKAPAKVIAKRQKAEKVAAFIMNGIGMKSDHFNGIIRNGIIKKYGRSPEKVIEDNMKGIKGIGALDAAENHKNAADLISAIAKVYGKTGMTISVADSPAASDFTRTAGPASSSMLKKTVAIDKNSDIKNQIRKAAPYFIYLYIKADQLPKVPEVVRTKRKKAEKVADFINATSGISKNEFMTLVTAGIKSKFAGKDPEILILDYMNGKVTGIGAITIMAITAIVEIFQKILSLFGKKPEVEITDNDMPGSDDWSGSSSFDAGTFSEDMMSQSLDRTYSSGGGGGLWSSLGN